MVVAMPSLDAHRLCAVMPGNADYLQQQARPLLTHLGELLHILPGLLLGVVQCSLQIPPVHVRHLGPLAQGLYLNLRLLELLPHLGQQLLRGLSFLLGCWRGVCCRCLCL